MSIPFQYKVVLYLPPFGRNSNANLWPPYSTPFFGGGEDRVDLGGGENCTNINLVPMFLFDFYTHYGHILHRLVIIHNAEDRQSDRTMAIGRLRYSIGGLKMKRPKILIAH